MSRNDFKQLKGTKIGPHLVSEGTYYVTSVYLDLQINSAANSAIHGKFATAGRFHYFGGENTATYLHGTSAKRSRKTVVIMCRVIFSEYK